MAPTSPNAPRAAHGRIWPRLLLLAAALLFSSGGMAIKSCQLTDWQIASYRCGIAAVALWLFLPASRRNWHWRVVPVGAVYAVTLLCYALANKSTTAANAIFLQSTAPLYLLVLSPWLLREGVRRRDLLLALAMGAGLVLLVTSGAEASATAPDPVRGNTFGAVAGLSWAFTVLGLRWLASSGIESNGGPRPGGDAVRAVVVGNVFGFLAGLPMALGGVRGEPSDWLWLAFLGVFQIGAAYALLTRAMERVPAFEASILLLAEPVFNPIWTFLVHGEVPLLGTWIGGGLILVATTVKTWVDFRSRTPPESDP